MNRGKYNNFFYFSFLYKKIGLYRIIAKYNILYYFIS